MKKVYFFLFICFCSFQLKTNAQGVTPNIESTAFSAIIQSIIDIPELQKYFPLESDNTIKQLNVVQFPVTLPASLSVTKGDKALNLIAAADQPSFNGDAYFMFRRVSNLNNKISITANYFYKNGGSSFKIITLVVNFENIGNSWNQINYSLNGDKL